MAFSEALIDAVSRCAVARGIAPAALLAVVEVECAGSPFEADGRTPRFLFERHVFYKELKARQPGKLQAAVDQGLAIPKWSRSTQYKDLGSSAGRARVLSAARGIDVECANRACSWGVGQIMGFLAAELGYGSASAMVSLLTSGGVSAQIDCLLRFIDKKRLIPKLNARDWAGFAATYNGPAYAQNDYDTRLAEAYARWKARLTLGAETPAEVDEVEGIPLGRTPVQNAEPTTSPWLTPEGVATGVGAGTGVVTAATGAGSGPVGYVLAAIILIAFCIGAYFFIQRMRRTPT